MASFASASDLATLMQRTLSPTEIDAAEMVLAFATSAIQSAVRQQIETVEADTVELRGNWTPYLQLPQRPVLDVTAISLSTPYTAVLTVGSTAYRWTRAGKVTLLWSPANWPTEGAGYGSWGGPDSTVSVTYSHGFDVIPADISGVCLRVARRMMDNPQMVMSESVGGYYNYTLAPGADPSSVLLPSEEAALRSAYRKKTR